MNGHLGISCQVTADGARSTHLPQAGLIRPSLLRISDLEEPVSWASLVAQMIKKSACDAGDLGLIPGLGRSPGEGMATLSGILAWRIPWTEEPGGL